MWKTVSSKEIFKHHRLTLIEDEVLLPNGKKIDYLKFKDDGSSSATIICKREDGKILLSKEISYPINKKLYQFPGGNVLANENIKSGANRELAEETDLKAYNLELIGSYLSNNRRSTRKMYVFLATNLSETKTEGDIEEEIENFWFSEKEIEKMIKKGEIVNCHLLASWALYKNKQN